MRKGTADMRGKKRRKLVGLLALPSVVGILFFYLMPLLEMVIRSFFRSSDKTLAGLGNYYEVYTNSAFRLASGNTLLFMVISVTLLGILSMLFSNLIVQTNGFWEHIRPVYVLPMAVPATAVALFWQAFWAKKGLLNLLTHMEIDWLNSSLGFMVLVVIFLWKYFGYTVLLWIGGMGNIPKEMMEAARVDGAGQWQIFFEIVLPNIRPTVFMIYTLSVINSFKIFRETYSLVGDYPHNSLYLLQNLFNNWMRGFELDKLAAGGVIYLMAMMLMILPMERIIKYE